MFASRSAPLNWSDHRPWIAILLAITAYRCIAGFVSPLPFQVDEAQYVGWSHFLSAGYFSKPPVIAWAIATGQGICSASGLLGSAAGIAAIEGCSRLLQPVAFLVAALAVGATAQRLFADARITFWAAILFTFLPLTGFYSLFASTDAWLIMFWALSLWLLVIAAQSEKNNLLIWAALGVAVGLGLLSKYSMGAFVISAFLWLLFSGRLFRMGPWAGLLVAALVFLPNLLWNYQNGFPTFAHHAEISQLAGETHRSLSISERFASAARFIAEQFGLFGLLLFPVLLWSLGTLRHAGSSGSADRNALLLLQIMTWVILMIAIAQAFSSRSFANWAAPAYVSGCILVAHALIHLRRAKAVFWGRAILAVSLIGGIVISFGLIHIPRYFFHHSTTDSSKDQYRVRALEKIRGWKEAALWAKEIAPQNGWIVLAQDRRLLAAISAYGYPEIRTPFAWNPQDQRDSHYNWFLDVRRQKFSSDQRFLLLQLIKPNAAASEPAMPGYRVVREINSESLKSLQVGGDGEKIVAYEIALEH